MAMFFSIEMLLLVLDLEYVAGKKKFESKWKKEDAVLCTYVPYRQ